MADTPTTQGSAQGNIPTQDDVFTCESAASKTYPLAPEGVHKVIVARATLKMQKKPAQFLSSKDDPNQEYPYIQLMLQTDKKYTDGTEEKNHNVFYKMKISDHKKATMTEFFNSVLGIAVPLSPEKKITLTTKSVEKDDKSKETHFTQFENLEFSAVVKHQKSEDGSKTFANVDSLFATPEQKAMNAALFRAP